MVQGRWRAQLSAGSERLLPFAGGKVVGNARRASENEAIAEMGQLGPHGDAFVPEAMI